MTTPAQPFGRIYEAIRANESRSAKKLGWKVLRVLWPERFTFWGRIKYYLGLLPPPKL